jgi:hypothetical protein
MRAGIAAGAIMLFFFVLLGPLQIGGTLLYLALALLSLFRTRGFGAGLARIDRRCSTGSGTRSGFRRWMPRRWSANCRRETRLQSQLLANSGRYGFEVAMISDSAYSRMTLSPTASPDRSTFLCAFIVLVVPSSNWNVTWRVPASSATTLAETS